ncbi:MAG: reverse transcriptase/maturase family protein [Patescibacteria group bacterium]
MPRSVCFFYLQKYKRSFPCAGGYSTITTIIHTYQDIITIENLLATWERFLCGKRHKKDVAGFEACLSDNLVSLHRDLLYKTYVHGPYSEFHVSDPKRRTIHKASVRDRFLHHVLYRALYPYFEERFIYDSCACREDKGIHKALERFDSFARKVSKNNTRTCYVLKCDIKRFFASVDQKILTRIIERNIGDRDILWLLGQVISSFHMVRSGLGLPLGNLTSQLLANIYMHEFDMFIKQELKGKYYIRYADDFLILSDNKDYLVVLLLKIRAFLHDHLRLSLHEKKVSIESYASGVDFLGWIHFPHHRQIRTITKRRIVRNLKGYPRRETINSYRGLLQHGDTHKLKEVIF